jgi:hypothetical protein
VFHSQSDINGDDEMEGEEMEMEDVLVSIIPQPLPGKTIRVQFLTTKQVMWPFENTVHIYRISSFEHLVILMLTLSICSHFVMFQGSANMSRL